MVSIQSQIVNKMRMPSQHPEYQICCYYRQETVQTCPRGGHILAKEANKKVILIH